MQRGRSEATEARADAEHANHRRRHEQGDAASAVPDGAGVGASGSTDDASDGENIFERFTLDQTRRFGQGAYGVTFAASDTANGGRPCAVKVINTTKLRGPNAVARCRSECLILENLSHPNVIRVLGHGTGRQSSGQDHLYFIFMELASGGELFDEVISSGALGEAVTRNFMRQILAGVEHCHARGVAHRDLKLENML
jgi:serine/threonine protein kinase